MQKPNKSIKRIRSSMIILCWILAILLLMYLFGYVLRYQQNPNTQPYSTVSKTGIREVTLKANRAHSYLVNGSINSHPVTFLLDTGATNVAIPSSINRTLKLPRGIKMLIQTAAGQTIAYRTKLKSLRIGTIQLNNVSATLNPSFKADYVLLGMNALKHLEFIHKENTLILRQDPTQ